MEDMEHSNSHDNTTTFTDYVITNWVETNRHLWNHYETEGPWTKNHLEGWHTSMKKTIQVPHPNMYRLLEHLKEEQAVNEVTLIQYAAGGVRPVKRRRYTQLYQRLQQLKLRLQNQDICVFQFADIASYLLHLDWSLYVLNCMTRYAMIIMNMFYVIVLLLLKNIVWN